MRLDAYLHAKQLAASRNKAQVMIEEGFVTVNGIVNIKSAYKVSEHDVVAVKTNPMQHYVSRSALKLAAFVTDLPITWQGSRCIDIGSSTGGFTQVLLEHNVMHVDCVDVGTAQLHPDIRNDSRVQVFESCDIRDFNVQKPYDIAVCDVSFISVRHLLATFDLLFGTWLIILFKPQFELGVEAKRNRHGVIEDDALILSSKQAFEAHIAATFNWQLHASAKASITGKEGNQEYCYAYTRA